MSSSDERTTETQGPHVDAARGSGDRRDSSQPRQAAAHTTDAYLVRDLGPKIAFVAVREGTPVYDAHRNRIGVVEEVIADRHAGIFKGLVIHTVPLPGRHLVADVDQISALHERGVLLSVDRHMLRSALRDAAKVPRAIPE